ncbi:MAG: porin family protein [Bacteroidota bacterium]|nr:porin family protein [Bacteroidota bacterium]
MLKKCTILLFCGFLTISIKAQNFGGGVILGLSTSQVGGDDLGGFNKAGLLIGIFANKSISELLSFQMEINYIQKGSNNPKMNENGTPDISTSYIEVPLLLQYHQSNKLKIEGGVQTAYLIDGYYNDLDGERPKYNDINPFINYDIGLLLGIDYNYSKNISLNTRISNSIFPIGAEDYENQAIYNYAIKGKYNSVLSFALHYNF